MAPRKAPVEQTPAPPQEAVQDPYHLEPMTDDIRSRINVLGNSMQMTVQQLQERAPGWANLINDLFETIGEIVRSAE